MQRFTCERCTRTAGFTADRCAHCGAELGYDPDERRLRELRPTAVASAFTTATSGRLHWRCLNAAWGCNWILLAHTGTVWCRSCALTRSRPADDRTHAVAGWATAEVAKRRLVHHLDDLGLPIVPRTPAEPDGLVFDFVAVPDTTTGLTGHHAGVVTVDLAEADDRHRDELRHRFNERARSILGHLRHEIGHHYLPRLVHHPEDVADFRGLFGDERRDYADALDDHYHRSHPCDTEQYVSAYAASHPLEDWAETFAHYLAVLDTTSTAAAHHFVTTRATGPAAGIDLDAVLDAWPHLATALQAIADSSGTTSPFDLDLPPAIRTKLTYVHQRIRATNPTTET